MQRSKVETFIGFSIKSRNLVTGANAIEATKGIKGIYICDSASDNTKKQVKDYARKIKVPLVLVKGKKVEELVLKDNCKVFAILDEKLNEAIMLNLDTNYEIIYKGDN